MLCWHVAIVWPGLKASARRSQHANATYRNIVGRNKLCVFGHPVATCHDMLGVVGSNLTTCNNMVAKRTQHVAPNNVATCRVGMLRSFGQGLKSKTLRKNHNSKQKRGHDQKISHSGRYMRLVLSLTSKKEKTPN